MSGVEATVAVEIAFDDPGVALGSVTWVDVSAYCRGFTTRRGRSRETDDFQAAAATVELDNRDRRFDPSYASSPHYPNVVPMRRIRISATHNAVTYRLFTGYVTGWPQEYTNPSDSIVSVPCVDAFEVLQQVQLTQTSVYKEEVLDDAPLAYYRLGEISGTTCRDSSGNGNHATYTGYTVLDSVDSLLPYDDANRAMGFNGTSQYANKDTSFGSSVVECLFSTTATGGTIVDDASKFTSGLAGSRLRFRLNSGKLRIEADNYVGTDSMRETTATYNDGQVHHVVASTAAIYVDGVSVATTTGSGAMGGPTDGAHFRIGDMTNAVDFFDGTLDEVAIYSSSLSAARVTAHYNGGFAPWAGDDSGARIGRLLDQAGWPSADRDIETGVSTLGPQAMGKSCLELCKEVEASEQGRLFVQADGKVVFQNRHHVLLDTDSSTSQGTFGDNIAAEFPYLNNGIAPLYDLSLVANTMSATRVGGETITKTDSASITDYLIRTAPNLTVYNETDTDVESMLDYRLDRYSQPSLRFGQLTVSPRVRPGSGATWTANQMWAAVLGAEVSDRYTVRRRPQSIGTIEQVGLVEGVGHTATPASWTTMFYLSPADTRDYWILDTSTLGTTTRLAF